MSKNATVSETFVYPSPKVAQITWDPQTGAVTPDTQLPAWVHTSKLVAKPDQLIKRRGKSGLLLLNKDWEQAKEWIVARAGKEVQVSYPTLSTTSYRVVHPLRALHIDGMQLAHCQTRVHHVYHIRHGYSIFLSASVKSHKL